MESVVVLQGNPLPIEKDLSGLQVMNQLLGSSRLSLARPNG